MRRSAALLVTSGAAAAATACTLLIGTGDLAGELDAGNDAAAPPLDAPADTIPNEDAADSAPHTDAGTYTDEVLADQPVLYFRLDEKTGAQAKDETGGASGTFVGSFTLGSQGAFDASTGVTFGTSGYLLAGHRAHFQGVQPFTLEGWLRPESLDNNYRGIVSHLVVDSAGRQSYALWVHATDGFAFERYVNGDFAVAQLRPPPAASVYHHVVGVFDGTALLFYVDGMLAGTTPDARSAPPTPAANVFVGRLESDSSSTLGPVDEVAIYGKALTTERVLAHWNASRR